MAPQASPLVQATARTKPDVPESTRDLTNTEKELLGLMRRVAFGRIERLEIVRGELGSREAWRVVRDVKLGTAQIGSKDAHCDFSLKREVQDFFCLIRGLDSAVLRKIEVRHGLPAHVQVEEPARQGGGR